MQTVHFIGRVVPPVLSVTIPAVSLSFTMTNGKFVKMVFGIAQSTVETICDLEAYDSEDLGELLVRCTDFVRVATNMASFATGLGMLLSFETIILPDGSRSSLAQGDESKRALCTAYRFPFKSIDEQSNFGKVAAIIQCDIHLRGAMNDIALAVIIHHQAPIMCGRVLDSLRRSIAPNIDRHKGWPFLHSAINIDRRYAEWISENSTNPRHGDWSVLSPHLVTQMVDRTWIIMNRIIEYRKRGNYPLAGPEFPLLKSLIEPS